MKLKIFILAIAAIFSCNACNVKAKNMDNKKVLIVYYSWSGNTRMMANMIKQATKADIFEVIPQTAYPTDYGDCVDQAKKEIKANYEPALKTKLPNLKDYDVIIVGSPCWWSTVAPPVRTFLKSYDFSGKTIVPFMTHGGSGFGNTISDIKKFCPQATLLKGLAVYGTSVKSSEKEIDKWLEGLNLIK